MSKLLTKKELADKLNVSVSTINYWVSNNKVPYVKVDKAVRFDYEEILAKFKKEGK